MKPQFHRALLDDIAPHPRDPYVQGDVDRDHRLATPEHSNRALICKAAVTSAMEIVATLSSALALRSDEIVASLAGHAAGDRSASRIPNRQKTG